MEARVGPFETRVRFTAISENRNSKKQGTDSWPARTRVKSATGKARRCATTPSSDVRSLPEPTKHVLSPSASHTWPLPGTPGRGTPSPSRFLHSQEATTRFGLRGHLGRGHNESSSWPEAPIGRRRVGAGTETPAEEPGRSRQPEGGGRQGCGRASIPAESAAPPAHRAFLTPAPSSALPAPGTSNHPFPFNNRAPPLPSLSPFCPPEADLSVTAPA